MKSANDSVVNDTLKSTTVPRTLLYITHACRTYCLQFQKPLDVRTLTTAAMQKNILCAGFESINKYFHADATIKGHAVVLAATTVM